MCKIGGREERLGAGRTLKARSRIRNSASVEREIRGHFMKKTQDLAIDWVEKECHEKEPKMSLTFYAWRTEEYWCH